MSQFGALELDAIARWFRKIPIDVQHLGRMTLGEPRWRLKFSRFSRQSGELIARIKTMPTDAGALAHTLKELGARVARFGLQKRRSASKPP